MTGTMQFDLLWPEGQLASFQDESVRLPGTEGEMTVMAGHAPVVAALRPGILRVEGGKGGEYIVTGGFADIGAAGVSVLAERAYRREDATRTDIQTALDEANAQLESASADNRDAAALLAADLGELLKEIT